jgi:hypothetical protein
MSTLHRQPLIRLTDDIEEELDKSDDPEWDICYYEDQMEEDEDLGCVLGAECIMPWPHFPSECHTSKDLENLFRENALRCAWYWPVVLKWREITGRVSWTIHHFFEKRSGVEEDIPF